MADDEVEVIHTPFIVELPETPEHPQPRAHYAGPNLVRWAEKANAYNQAWHDVFGVYCTSYLSVALGLSVAQHETLCGDAWPGEWNWGAVQKRQLNAEEHAALTAAGIHPSPNNVAAARSAISQAIQGGKCPPLDHEALHCDSSPVHGWYFVYFWAFDNDEQGAQRFIKTLAEHRPTCKMVLDRASMRNMYRQALTLAADMYATGYYEGVHNPSTLAGKQANINDYTSAIYPLFTAIAGDLKQAKWSSVQSQPST